VQNNLFLRYSSYLIFITVFLLKINWNTFIFLYRERRPIQARKALLLEDNVLLLYNSWWSVTIESSGCCISWPSSKLMALFAGGR